jgi:hypothetical protein
VKIHYPGLDEAVKATHTWTNYQGMQSLTSVLSMHNTHSLTQEGYKYLKLNAVNSICTVAQIHQFSAYCLLPVILLHKSNWMPPCSTHRSHSQLG